MGTSVKDLTQAEGVFTLHKSGSFQNEGTDSRSDNSYLGLGLSLII